MIVLFCKFVHLYPNISIWVMASLVLGYHFNLCSGESFWNTKSIVCPLKTCKIGCFKGHLENRYSWGIHLIGSNAVLSLELFSVDGNCFYPWWFCSQRAINGGNQQAVGIDNSLELLVSRLLCFGADLGINGNTFSVIFDFWLASLMKKGDWLVHWTCYTLNDYVWIVFWLDSCGQGRDRALPSYSPQLHRSKRPQIIRATERKNIIILLIFSFWPQVCPSLWPSY